MKKVFFVVSVFIICLLTVRAIYGVEASFQTDELLSFVGAFDSNYESIESLGDDMSTILAEFKNAIAGGIEFESDFKNGNITLKDIGNILLYVFEYIKFLVNTFVLFIRLIYTYCELAVKNACVVIQIVSYLIFGIK